jgi:hypothetical protein
MPEQTMNWSFEPRRGDGAAGHDDDDPPPGPVTLPAALLQRHGAVVLDPGSAVAVRGLPVPRPTVYRAKTLLIPGNLPLTPVNDVLRRIGLTLEPTEPGQDTAYGDGDQDIAGVLRQLPRTAVLVPVKDHDVPVRIDAWHALQTLRAAAARDKSELDEATVAKISLEHLLIGSSTMFGSPVTAGPGGETAEGAALTGPGSADSYVYSGGDTRTPVEVLLEAPPRDSAGACETEYGRRSVVAVLDTGLRVHPWLNVAKEGGSYKTEAGGFAVIDDDIQKAIRAAGESAATLGDQPREVIRHPWDTPVTADPLIGELDDATGHGTFIAGIVRQIAPNAEVLAVRVMHSDGMVYEGDVLCALRHLIKRVAHAEAGHPAEMVDVVSLSFGYVSESGAAPDFALWQAIKALLDLGVVVVAAAGNSATSRKFYPAAFSREPVPAGAVPVISVGALNPNGSKAMFSNGGRWVTAWAPGAAVISTFPTDINGSRTPELKVRAHPANHLPGDREALDPDDYSAGWASWSGTSFSAPLLAAHIARSLLADAAGAAGAQAGLRLDLPGKPAAAKRAAAAMTKLGWPG